MRPCFICAKETECEHREPELRKSPFPQEQPDLCTYFPQPRTKRKPASSQGLLFDALGHVEILYDSRVEKRGKLARR